MFDDLRFDGGEWALLACGLILVLVALVCRLRAGKIRRDQRTSPGASLLILAFLLSGFVGVVLMLWAYAGGWNHSKTSRAYSDLGKQGIQVEELSVKQRTVVTDNFGCELNFALYEWQGHFYAAAERGDDWYVLNREKIDKMSVIACGQPEDDD